jgi:hypothetical protein
MTIWMISGALGFAGGFAVCWFYRSYVEKAVIATNNAVNDIKKL